MCPDAMSTWVTWLKWLLKYTSANSMALQPATHLIYHIIKHPLFHVLHVSDGPLRWDVIIHSIAQDVAKKTSPLMGVSVIEVSVTETGGKRVVFFSGLTNDWNLGRCTNNTRGNGKQQEEEGEETETEETGQDFHFFETFFLTSKHELLTCFGHLRCCKLRKVPLPHLGFNLVSFFNGTFLTKKGDTHGVTHFFPGWNI